MRQALTQLQQAMQQLPAERRGGQGAQRLDREVGEAQASLQGDRPDVARARAQVEEVLVAIPIFRVELSGTAANAPGDATVVVREGSANIQVQQAQPQVTVQQPQPVVTVVVPQPEIIVRQPPPQNSRYCVLTDWLNPILDEIGLWPALERMIGRVERAR